MKITYLIEREVDDKMKIKDGKYFTKVVYVAGRYQGCSANKNYIETYCKQFTKEYPDVLFINGVSALSFYYDCTSQLQGIAMCLELMKRCADEVWVLGDDNNVSVGTNVEIFTAYENNIPIFSYDTTSDLLTRLDIVPEPMEYS